MNFPKVIFTYIDINGRECSISKDIVGCCVDCEIEKISDVFEDFLSSICDYIFDQHRDDSEDDEETKANKAKFDKRYFGNDDDDDEYIGLTD